MENKTKTSVLVLEVGVGKMPLLYKIMNYNSWLEQLICIETQDAVKTFQDATVDYIYYLINKTEERTNI